ncbi:PREDICTED: early nodulin-like protein 1 [Brassica oleracea var. oleracea]|uniref:Phytocyanin domain-containing protein n=3 Tax=Brassica TaxID=3705 RepID=A0A0D3E463_BRAOL|nr:PREDICTED: early nodulin-like protein 1 [Brassica oleracea var. oleracea]XP_013609358.1 PREDICTED: early nodulin-like protein 1 [Brassica oleracea var. oleracea]
MNCIDRMIDIVHLRPCAPVLQSGVQRSFPYSLTFTNLYELSFSDTKLTQTERKREMGMMSLSSVMVLSMILLVQVSSTQYKVGNLDSWGIPTDAKVYSKWPKSHSFKIGDSLLFLYPPSEDSMIQVTASNFKSCNTKDPILYMNDGNSLFNLTQNGTFYFTSGHPGHCQKYQKLIVSVGPYSAEADALSPSSSSADADAPSYQNAFGSIPLSQKSSSSSPLFSTVVASLACAVVVGALM